MTVNREDLKAFIDGELPVQTSKEIRTQMEHNGAMAEEVAFLKLLGQGVRECASDPVVVGADEVRVRFKKRKRYILEMFVCGFAVLVFCAYLFPVFAQSKLAAKRISGHESIAAMNKPSNGFTSLDEPSASASAPSVQDKAAMKAPMASGKSMAGRTPDSFKEDQGTVTKAAASQPNYFLKQRQSEGVASPKSPNAGNLQFNEPASRDDSPSSMPGDANRMVVQNAELDEVVHDVQTAENEAMDYTRALSGFVASSSLTKNGGGMQEADLSVRIPARAFTLALNHFKALALDSKHIVSVNVTGEDVTGQYADTTARQKVLEAEEDSYVIMLRSARKLGEILAIKDRLSNVRQQIESLKAQASTLKNTSDMSTISLTFEQESKPVTPPKAGTSASWSGQAWTSAVGGLHDLLQVLATAAIFLFVYSPIWIPLGLLGFWLYRRSR